MRVLARTDRRATTDKLESADKQALLTVPLLLCRVQLLPSSGTCYHSHGDTFYCRLNCIRARLHAVRPVATESGHADNASKRLVLGQVRWSSHCYGSLIEPATSRNRQLQLVLQYLVSRILW